MIFKLGGSSVRPELHSPPFFGNIINRYCLRFWYWRHASQDNIIDVWVEGPYITSTLIWESDYQFPNRIWHRAQMNVDLGNQNFIAIRAMQHCKYREQRTWPRGIRSRPPKFQPPLCR